MGMGITPREAPHLVKICDRLTDVVKGKTDRLIINVSPRSGKTEFAVKMFISWGMGLNPFSNFIHVSYTHRLAANNAHAVRKYMRSELYRDLFFHSHPSPPELAMDSQAKDEFKTVQGGCVYATGAQGTITGFGAGSMDADVFSGAIIVDDILKPSEANSEHIRKRGIEWFSETLENRKNSPRTPIIVIGQRLHEEDLPGWLMSGGNGEEWELLKIPALDENGESFWPQQFPVSMLKRMQVANPYVYSGQYQQDPSPKGGGDFKPARIEIVDALPHGLSFARGWDLAGTKNKTSDYTASVKLAIKDGVTWISDVFRFRGSPDEVEKKLQQTAAIDGLDTTQELPQDPGQAGVYQKNTLSKLLQGARFNFGLESGDKRLRALSVAAQVNVGNVKMVRGDWNKEFIQELEQFPFGANDDQVDALSRAYNSLTTGKKSFLARRR